MKVSAVINKPSFSVDTTKKSAIISSIILVVGIISGTIIYFVTDESLINELWDYFISFSTDFSNKNKTEIISGLIMQNLIYYILMLLFATCFFGAPAVVVTSFLKASGLGMLTAYIYDNFALKGVEYGLLVIFPGKIILILAMILLTQNCCMTSLDIKNYITNNSNKIVDLKKFALRSILILILILISCLIDFLTIVSFSSLFDFS